MAILIPNGQQQYFNNTGGFLSGGKIYTYAAGTVVPKETYTTATGGVPNANPVVLDGTGSASIFWDGYYYIEVRDSSNQLIYSQDNVVAITYASITQAQNGSLTFLNTVSGTNTITATTTPALTFYIAGQRFSFIVANTNTAATTLDVSGLGARNITKRGNFALGAGDLTQNSMAEVEYDGTQFQLVNVSSVSAVGSPPICNGRLTLTSGAAVTTGDVSGATTVYFTPYKGNQISIYNGTVWVNYVFTELSQATTDITKSPASVANNSNYDVFAWNDSGTLRATRGPAWSSDTSRGTGAGTTEIELFEGRYVNKVAITNGPGARLGLFVGTMRSDGSAQINDAFAKRHVWNNYNRVDRPMRVVESTDSWTYNTNALRQANNSSANQLDIVIGLSEDEVYAIVNHHAANSVGASNVSAGVGLDVTNALASGFISNGKAFFIANVPAQIGGAWKGFPGIGRHTLTWLENGEGTGGTTTWYGDNGTPTIFQSGISGSVCA